MGGGAPRARFAIVRSRRAGCACARPLKLTVRGQVRYALVPLLCLAGCVSGQPRALTHDSVFVGSLRAVTLVPRDDSEDIFPPLEESIRRAPPSTSEITVSNACGLEQYDFHVLETLAGPKLPLEVHFSAVLGEWCKPDVDILRRPVLIVVSDVARDSGTVRIDHYDIVRGTGARLAFILPHWATTIGNVELIPLLADLGFEYPCRPVADTPAFLQASLRASGYIREHDGYFYYTKAVYIDDLRKALASNNRWRGP